jgi:hypothetical protein
MKKITYLIFATMLLSCTPSSDNPGGSLTPTRVNSVVGLDDATTIVGHHFNPLKGVQVITDTGEDYANRLQITGHVDYSFPGVYPLTYRINTDSLTYSKTRNVTVATGTYVPPTNPKSYITVPSDTLGE